MCGEVASAMTVQITVDRLRHGLLGVVPDEAIEDAITEANRCVFEKARCEQACTGMGSTVVLASGASLRTEMVGPASASLELERGRAMVRVMHTRTRSRSSLSIRRS